MQLKWQRIFERISFHCHHQHAPILPPWLLVRISVVSSQGQRSSEAELLIVCGQTTDKQWAVRHQHQAAPCRIIIATSSAEIAGLVLVVRIRNFRHDYQEIMTRHSHNHPHYHPDELSCTQEVSKHQQQVARSQDSNCILFPSLAYLHLSIVNVLLCRTVDIVSCCRIIKHPLAFNWV